jgi:hypothetical protein
MFGIVFAVTCGILNLIYPGAYSGPTESGLRIYEFLYYSFITQASVGYGDITPQIPQTQSLAIIIGITGQLYMAIIVATLVGKFLLQSSSGQS